MNKLHSTLAASALSIGLAFSGVASATLLYNVSLDTQAISGAGGYAIAFSLQDGEGIGDANNTVRISGFAFGGGSAAGGATRVNGATGGLAATVTLNDSSFSNLFVEGFTPGSVLKFSIELTTEVDAAGVPDFFGFSLLHDGTPIATLDDTLGDNLLYVNFDGASPVPVTWAGNDPLVQLSAPVVTPGTPGDPNGGPIPEPGTGLLALAGIGLALSRARRRP